MMNKIKAEPLKKASNNKKRPHLIKVWTLIVLVEHTGPEPNRLKTRSNQ